MSQMLSFWKDWLHMQLSNNLEQIVKDSIKDMHCPGLNYVCFQFTPYMTIRLYLTHPDQPMATENVSIHNHLYDSQLLMLCGVAENTVYSVESHQNRKDFYHRYYLTSALHPDNKEKSIKLSFIDKVYLRKEKEILLQPGDSHLQLHDEVHGVVNDPAKLTAWMVFEYPTIKKHSMLFSKQALGKTIATPNCYQRYSAKEIQWLVNDVICNM